MNHNNFATITGSILFALSLVWFGAINAHAFTVNPNIVEQITGTPLPDIPEPEPTKERTATSTHQFRPEGETYFSVPKWYIIHSAEEYGALVERGGRPSQFHWIGNVMQYWDIVATLRATTDDIYTIEQETSTQTYREGIRLIIMYGIGGLYENTIGFISEWSFFTNKTPEDKYLDRVARQYADFIRHSEWYEYPYIEAVRGLWSRESLGLGSISLRGVERRIAYTVSFTVKAWAARAVSLSNEKEPSLSERETLVAVASSTEETLIAIDGLSILADEERDELYESIEEFDESSIYARTGRANAFRDTVLSILDTDGVITAVEGNKNILVSTVGDGGYTCIDDGVDVVLQHTILTQAPITRYVLLTKVDQLGTVVEELAICNATIEHVYDY